LAQQQRLVYSTLRTLFIINPRSGTPKFVSRLHYLIRRQFGADNRRITVVKSRSLQHILDLATKATAEEYEMVVAVGGDGTINTTAQGLVGSSTILGVLPTGSGNGFARNVGVPLRLEKALEMLSDPKIMTIDVGQVGDRIFLVSCGIGWEAVIATVFEGSKIRGVIPYATAVLTTFLQYEPQEIELIAEPGSWSYRGRPMLFTVANMREYGVGVTIAPDAKMADGLLDICLIPRHDLLSALKYSPDMLFRGRTDTIPGYLHRLASSVVIRRPIAGNIHLDGSPTLFDEEIKITVRPSALRIVAHPKVFE
jgi:diacylglycerol kinase (ATP)